MNYTVGCDAEGRLTAVEGAHARRLGRLRLGRRQGARARGRPRLRAVPRAGASTSRRSPPTPTTRPAARCAASASTRRASPSRAASTCSPRRSASTAGRCAGATSSRSATLSPPARCSRSRSASEKTLLAVKDAYDAARAARARGRHRLRHQELRASATASIEWGKCRLVVEPDGTVALYNGYTEMGQGLLTVLIQFAVEVTGLPAAVFRPQVDTPLRARLRPDHRLARDAARRARGRSSAAREAARPTSTPGATLADLVGPRLRRRVRDRRHHRRSASRRTARSRPTPPSASRRRS